MAKDSSRYEWRRAVNCDPTLSEVERRVLLHLESFADRSGRNARPGVRKLAEELRTPRGHIAESSVKSALAVGLRRGLIEITEKAPRGRGVRKANVYALIPVGQAADNEPIQTGPLTDCENEPIQTGPLTAEKEPIAALNRADGPPEKEPIQIGHHQVLPNGSTNYPPPEIPSEAAGFSSVTRARVAAPARESDPGNETDDAVVDASRLTGKQLRAGLCRVERALAGGFYAGEWDQAAHWLRSGLSRDQVVDTLKALRTLNETQLNAGARPRPRLTIATEDQ